MFRVIGVGKRHNFPKFNEAMVKYKELNATGRSTIFSLRHPKAISSIALFASVNFDVSQLSDGYFLSNDDNTTCGHKRAFHKFEDRRK